MPKAIIPAAPAAVAACAAVYRAAVDALAAAEAAKVAAAAELMAAMLAADMRAARTESGTVSITEGRETIVIVCDALKAEIDAIRKRSVRTGRGKLNKGAPYVTLRK